ncbi:MAG: 2-oxoacid:acceptor oxidoreductase family protein [Oscillospiraceae bacterium]|nr:2-oxoacid:acceptor oxidoreductase family protein [Oscillospiraceae bacterium]
MAGLNVIFAGFGGQGILFTGKVVAYAGLIDGKEVSWLPSYGPEMRGGTANCSVCVSDEPIGSPLVTEPDVLVAMNIPSYDKFIDTVKPGGLVVVDSSLIDRKCERDDVRFAAVPATRLSNEEHLEGIANMILLGRMLKGVEFASLETVERAVGKCVPASKTHLLEHNMRAIRLGYSL